MGCLGSQKKKRLSVTLLLMLFLMMFSGGAVLADSGASTVGPNFVSGLPYERPTPGVFETTGSIISLANPDEDYVEGTARIDISGLSLFDDYNGVSDGNLKLSFSNPMTRLNVPNGWNNWFSPPYSEDDTPDILWSGWDNNELTIKLSEPVSTFGFELEPNSYSTFDYTVKYYSQGKLVGSIIRTVTSPAAGRLFAAQTKSGLFDKIVITSNGDSYGFAIAQIRYVIPEMSLSVAPDIFGQYILMGAKCYTGPLQIEGYRVGFIIDNKYVGVASTDSNGYARIRCDISSLDQGVHTAYAKYGDIWASAKFVIGDVK